MYGSALRTLGGLAEDQDFIPRTHMVAQFQGLQHPFLYSLSTRLTSDAYIHACMPKSYT